MYKKIIHLIFFYYKNLLKKIVYIIFLFEKNNKTLQVFSSFPSFVDSMNVETHLLLIYDKHIHFPRKRKYFLLKQIVIDDVKGPPYVIFLSLWCSGDVRMHLLSAKKNRSNDDRS